LYLRATLKSISSAFVLPNIVRFYSIATQFQILKRFNQAEKYGPLPLRQGCLLFLGWDNERFLVEIPFKPTFYS
ncbi:MAG: hypothetical protein PVI89_15300, partial [Desulfobacteraceae bacterium]